MAQPVISYPGAKWRFYPYMKEYFPRDMKTFIEPFFGGGSVSLSVADDPYFNKVERIIGGDLAPEVWAHWVGIRDNAPDVVDICYKWWKEKCPLHNQYLKDGIDENAENYEELYNALIEEGQNFWKWSQTVDCTTLSLPERAARLFLVNRISFSGMGDSGSMSKDQFMNFKLNRTERILMAQPLLQRMEILNVSFEDTMKYANDDPKNTFIFLDPPYWKQEESGLYGKGGDTHKGFPHEEFCKHTRTMQCKWFMTYDDSVYVRRQFRGRDDHGKKIHILPFVIPGGYTMAGKTSEDALAGEELFIANYKLDQTDENLMDIL